MRRCPGVGWSATPRSVLAVGALSSLVLVGLVIWGKPVSARELWSSADGDKVLDGGGFLKSQGLGLWFGDLDLLSQQAAAESAGTQTLRLRVFTKLYVGDFRLSVAEESRYSVASAGMENLGTLPGFGATTGSRPRLFEIPGYAEGGVRVENDLDRLNAKVSLGPLDLTLGRQAISWGSAWFWKPTDRFGPFSPMDIDPEVKRGVDAARAEVYFGPMTSLDLIATFERHDEEESPDRPLWVSGGVRFRSSVGPYDLALSLARYQYSVEGNWMVGLETSGSIGPVGVRGEATVNRMEDSGAWDVEAVVGADYRFPWKLQMAGEAFYNGYGELDPADYATLLTDPVKGERLARGEAFNVGRYYLGLMLAQEVHPLLTLTVSAIGNLADPSAMVIAGLRWLPVQDARVSAGVLVPWGARPDGMVMQSEFGSMPFAGYVVLKIAF